MRTSWLSYVQSILNTRTLSRLRRNHGLEHATLHVLAERYPRQSFAGHSNPDGFWLIGNLPTEAVQSAVEEGLSRLKNGERRLAVHPNCGTNLVVAGTIAGLAGASAMFGVGKRWQDKLERLPLAAALATFGLILAQPLAIRLQENVTTSGEPGNLEIVEVIPSQQGRFKTYRIVTIG